MLKETVNFVHFYMNKCSSMQKKVIVLLSGNSTIRPPFVFLLVWIRESLVYLENIFPLLSNLSKKPRTEITRSLAKRSQSFVNFCMIFIDNVFKFHNYI